MDFGFYFFFNSIMLGVGLAMDAFSVSMANGLNEPDMKHRRMGGIAGVFAGFQFLMPMLGWICVHTVAQIFTSFERWIPWIALALLTYIGGKMLLDAFKSRGTEEETPAVGIAGLMLQGVATSIDALSVGFTIAHYDFVSAFVCCLLIAVTTFFICVGGLRIGRRFGTRLAGRASFLGGVILIAIGLEIFITGVF